MKNYVELIYEYFEEKDNLIYFESFSNDVRIFKNKIIKQFKSNERFERSIFAANIIENTLINSPWIEFISEKYRIIVEEYIQGITLDEYKIHIEKDLLYNIGILMGNLHNIAIKKEIFYRDWLDFILLDIKNLKNLFSNFSDFKDSFDFIEN